MLKTKAGAIIGTPMAGGPLGTPIPAPPQLIQFLRRDAVCRLTGLPVSTIYELMSRGEFPKNFHISPRLCAWRADEIAEWQRARMASREFVDV